MPSQFKLFLIKHARPVFETGLPASQWRLSDEGRRGALRLVQSLAGESIQAVYTSHEPKAQETGQILAEALGLPCETVPGLHEHLRGPVQSLDQAPFERQVAELFAHPDQVVFGYESANQACRRFSLAVDSILARHSEPCSPAIVAHGTVISLFASRRCGLDGFELWKKLGLPFYIVLGWPGWEVIGIQEEIPQDMI